MQTIRKWFGKKDSYVAVPTIEDDSDDEITTGELCQMVFYHKWTGPLTDAEIRKMAELLLDDCMPHELTWKTFKHLEKCVNIHHVQLSTETLIVLKKFKDECDMPTELKKCLEPFETHPNFNVIRSTIRKMYQKNRCCQNIRPMIEADNDSVKITWPFWQVKINPQGKQIPMSLKLFTNS